MKDRTVRSVVTICCVCVFLILMCTFFIEEAHAAAVAKGTTTRKEQTVKLTLKKGTAVITVKDADSWVYAQLQTTGSNKLGTAINGDTLLAQIGQKKTFTVPVRKSGTYYLYLHGTNKGATYSVQRVAAGGKLTSATPKLGTSYANNSSVVYYRIDVPSRGRLIVKATDASYRYPGYNKITLKKGKKRTVCSEEEHLIKGLGYKTYYGVTEGTYYIGVRSSSELYNLTATFKPITITRSGRSTKTATDITGKKKNANGVFRTTDTEKRWYKVVLPAQKSGKKTIKVSALNSNHNVTGGIRVTLLTKKKNGKSLKKSYLLNNSSITKEFKAFRKKARVIYIRVNTEKGASGTYSISSK